MVRASTGDAAMSFTTYNNVTIPSFIYETAWKKEATTGMVLQAMEAGLTTIDVANQLVHYDESRVWEALLQLTKHGITRGTLFLQTKFTPVNGQAVSLQSFLLDQPGSQNRIMRPSATISRPRSR